MRPTLPEAVALLREAASVLEQAARDDRETIGELAARANTHDGELAELRDGLVELGAKLDAMARTLDGRTGHLT